MDLGEPLLSDAVKSAHNSPFPLLPWQIAEADSAMGAYLAKRGQVSRAERSLRNTEVAMHSGCRNARIAWLSFPMSTRSSEFLPL
jgi:hypothetical protein